MSVVSQPSARRVRLAVFTVIGLTLVAAGPLVGADVGNADGPRLEAGNATIAVDQPGSAPITVDRGRFGTDVRYVRLPPLAATVTGRTGSPRVLYRVRIPALGVDRSGRRLLAEAGTGSRIRISLADRALPPDRLDADRYAARIVIRVQSLSTDWTVRNESVPVVVTE